MPAWTEEVGSSTLPLDFPARARSDGALEVAGVPWLTLAFLLSCVWILLLAGGLRSGLALGGLLSWGAKATPLILDRGDTWRLLTANALHKDALHLLFNAFAIWNVGGALERAVRPADYLALLLFTALGTTLVSALGADSISLGASGIAFGLLGASASFGWRRRVEGPLRAHFGLRVVPWLCALFAAGLGSSGVDNWGHAGGLLTGAGLGLFLLPRSWAGEGPSRRLAAGLGATLGTVAIGLMAAPALPILGAPREGPASTELRVPLGWRKAFVSPDRVAWTNGLTAGYRSSLAVVAAAPCTRGKSCGCERLVRAAFGEDLQRMADVGLFQELVLVEDGAHAEVSGTASGAEGTAAVSAACTVRDGLPFVVLALQPRPAAGMLARRAAESLRIAPAAPPVKP